MRSSSTRLATALAVLLTAAACSRNETPAEQPPPATTEAPGTENAVAPPAAEGAPVDPPSVAPSPEAPAPAVVVPPPAAQRTARPDRDRRETPADEGAAARPSGSTPVDAPSAVAADRDAPPRSAPVRTVSIPENTRLLLALQTAVGSDTSSVEDRVSARVTESVVVDGETVIPEGSRVDGRVTYVQPSGKVKGRAGVTVRFHSLTVGSSSYDIVAEPLRRQAEGTRARDARNIGLGAGAGAVIGGIIGGRKGAGIGAAVGGAGGTGVVLATKGAEVRLPAGTVVTTRLADPLVVDVRSGRQ